MSLFRAIVKAFVQNAGNFASGLVGVPIAGDIVVDAWDNWQKETDERQRKAELENYARQQVDAALAEAKAIVQREAPQLAADLRAALVQYLAQVPASIRRSLRRPADHTGLTVPAGLALRSANDLLPFLPLKLPRFKPGDRPLANSDLELLELLGQGGFGEVWKARHLDRPKLPPVALKFCLDAAAARSLEREKELLDHVASAGKHDGIVQLLYTHLRANPPCLEYECVEGGDLTGVFAELHANGLPAAELVAKVILNLTRIVAFAHGQNPAIVHRDLKPANILVRRRDGKLAFKIADFGIGGLWAKEALHKLQTGQTRPSERKHDTVLGAYTPLYASPEQEAGQPPNPRDDVHALGIIWFQLQTGRLGLMSLPSDWRDDLVAAKMPGPLLDLLASCIGRQERRPKDAGDLAERLATALAAAGNAGQPEANDDRPRHRPGPTAPGPDAGTPRHEEARPLGSRTGRRQYWLLAACLLAVGVLLVVVIGLWMAGQNGTIPSAKKGSPKKDSIAKKTDKQDIQTPPLAKNLELDLGGGVKLKLVRIDQGTFRMGSPATEAERLDNELQHEVEITRPYYMGINTVTQAQYRQVMGQNPSWFSAQGKGADKVAGLNTDDFPVETVSWHEAKAFCDKVSALPEIKSRGLVVDLPTEAEWEYACRADTTTAFHYGNALSSKEANFNGKYPYGGAVEGPYLGRTTKVGSYAPNAWGLYDMHGNVWQWCKDWYAKDYQNGDKKDPQGADNGGARVLRGGSWSGYARYCRAAYRLSFAPEGRDFSSGFRLVVRPPLRTP